MDNKNQNIEDKLVQKLEELGRAIVENPLDAKNYLNRGFIKSKLGDNEGALEDFTKAINLDENIISAYHNRGVVKGDLGDKEGALEDYNKAIELDEKYAEAYNGRGVIKSCLCDKKDALEDFNKAIELDEKYVDAYSNRGTIKDNLDDKEGALEDYNKAIELDEKYVLAYNNRGNVKADLDDKEGALEDYNKAIDLDEKFADAYYNRGVVKGDLGDKKGALEDYNKAIELDEKNALAYNNRGNVKADLDDKEGALEDYNKAIELDEKKAFAYNNRGTVKADLDDKEGALEDYNNAIELDEKNGPAYNNRGILKRAMIEYEDCLKIIDELSDKTDREPSISEQITKIRAGFDSSIFDLEKAVELDVHSKKYQNNLRNTKEMYDHFEFEISLNPQAQTGYLVFADIMGWKGIWQKRDFNENTTLKTMLRIKRRLLKIETDFELKVNLISDTFVIFSNQLELISNACKILIESCLESNLLIRGAMAYGTYYNLDTVYVGPTVDEAASWHEKAEEVVIMCTTSARREIEKSDSYALKKAGMVEREVSTKQGKIKTFVVDWYTEENKSNFLNIMDSTQVYPELYYKYINTEKALNEILDKKNQMVRSV